MQMVQEKNVEDAINSRINVFFKEVADSSKLLSDDLKNLCITYLGLAKETYEEKAITIINDAVKVELIEDADDGEYQVEKNDSEMEEEHKKSKLDGVEVLGNAKKKIRKKKRTKNHEQSSWSPVSP